MQLTFILSAIVALVFSLDAVADLWTLGKTGPAWLDHFLVGAMLLAVVCNVLAYLVPGQLSKGLLSARWNDQEIESGRLLIRSPVVRNLSLIYLGVWLINYVALRSRHQHLGDLAFAYIALWPINAVGAQFKVSPKRSAVSWTDMAPLHSEHWGRPAV